MTEVDRVRQARPKAVETAIADLEQAAGISMSHLRQQLGLVPAGPLRPPTFAQARRCAECLHFKEASCQHPLAEWHYGFDTMPMLQKSRPRWPHTDPQDWCGFWRPCP